MPLPPGSLRNGGGTPRKGEGSIVKQEIVPGVTPKQEQCDEAVGAAKHESLGHVNTLKAEVQQLASKPCQPRGLSTAEVGTEDVGKAVEDPNSHDPSHEELSDFDELNEHVAISPYSLAARFPKTAWSQSVGRIRTTVHGYTGAIQDIEWAQSFKAPTVVALGRRLDPYKEAMDSFEDVEIGNARKQLAGRLDALISMHKILADWATTKSTRALEHILPPLQLLSHYVHAIGGEVAPDLQMLGAYAQFFACVQKNGSVSAALSGFNFKNFQVLCDQYHSAQIEKQLEPSEDLKVEDDEEDEGQQAPPKRKARKNKKASDSLAWIAQRLSPDPWGQMAQLVADATKPVMSRMPDNILEDKVAVGILINEFDQLLKAWNTIDGEGEAANHFAATINAMLKIFQCGLKDESARPTVADVRAARRRLLSDVKGDKAPAGLAKCLTFKGPSAFMKVGKDFAADGIRDETATARFVHAQDHLEAELHMAFEDMGNYIERGNAGNHQDVLSFLLIFNLVKAGAIELSTCVREWSPGALSANGSSLEDYMQNIMHLLRISSYVLAHTIDAFLESVKSAPAEPAMANIVKSGETEPDTLELFRDGPEIDSDAKHTQEDAAKAAEGALEVQPTPLTFPSFASMAASAKSHHDNVLAFLSASKEATEFCAKVWDRVSERLVGQADMWTDPDLHPKTLVEEILENTRYASDLGDYLLQGGIIMGLPPVTDETALAEVAIDGSYMQALLSFCAIHNTWISKGVFQLNVACCIDATDLLDRMTASLTSLVNTSGSAIFKEHGSCLLHFLVEQIVNCNVKINNVHDHVLDATNTKDLLSVMLVQPTVSDFAKLCPLRVEEAEGSNSLDLGASMHQKAYQILKKYFETVGAETLQIPGVRYAADEIEKALPVADALRVLNIFCEARDLCLVAVALNVALVTPVTDGKKVRKDAFFGYVDALQSALQNKLTSFDSLVNSEGVLAIEKSGWQLTHSSVGDFRALLRTLSKFSGACLNTLLGEYARVLEEEVRDVKSRLHTWEAIFEDNESGEKIFSESLAHDLLLNKNSIVIAAHNKVHTLLASLSDAATNLSLSPRLQDHPITSPAVAVAKRALEQARVASSVAIGVDVLLKFKNHVEGPKKAAKYLEEHRTEANREVPRSFWEELEHLAAHAVAHAKVEVAPTSAAGGQQCAGVAPEASGAAASSTARPASTKTEAASAEVATPKRANSFAHQPALKRRRH